LQEETWLARLMPVGRPKTELVLSEEECVELSSLAGLRSLPRALVARAKVVLWSAEGASDTEIADRLRSTLKLTLSRKPKAATHWTVREAARASGISKSTVHRFFQAFAIRSSSRRCKTLPDFYLNPPDDAVVRASATSRV